MAVIWSSNLKQTSTTSVSLLLINHPCLACKYKYLHILSVFMPAWVFAWGPLQQTFCGFDSHQVKIKCYDFFCFCDGFCCYGTQHYITDSSDRLVCKMIKSNVSL